MTSFNPQYASNQIPSEVRIRDLGIPDHALFFKRVEERERHALPKGFVVCESMNNVKS